MSNTESKISVGIISLGACALTEPESGFPVRGAELQLYLVARKLAAQEDLRVTLHVADVGQGERKDADLVIRPLVKMGHDLDVTFAGAFPIRRRLARAKHDVYITRSASGINGLVLIAAHLAGGRHLHMCAQDRECAAEPDPALSWLARRLHHLAMRRADMLTCQTAQQHTALRLRYSREGFIVPNLPPPAPPPVPLESRRGALWVGRDVDLKHPELFVELARRLPDWNFTMVCQPQRGRDLRRLDANAPSRLRLIPGLPFDETARLFATHKLLVCTSTAEGFPNIILQAVVAGTPVVSFIVDPDNMIHHHGLGAVCGGDLPRFVHACRNVLENPEVWHDYHRAAIRWAENQGHKDSPMPDLIRSLARAGRA